MIQIFQYKKFDAIIMLGLIALWLAAFKSAALFSFLGTYSSLWYLPAGITLSIAIAVPPRFVIAPLLANWLLATPIVSSILHVDYTSVADHLMHGTRLFLVYTGAGLVLRYGLKVRFPVSSLPDLQKLISVTLVASFLGAASGVSLHVTMGSFDWIVARDILLPWMIGDGVAAIIVPPLLVPLLSRYFSENEVVAVDGILPSTGWLVFQTLTILVAMFVAFGLSSELPNLESLWYVVVLPPIIFAVTGGIPSAASAIFITALLTPPVATLLGFEGERISLQFLLLIGGVVSLMIGGAITDRNRAFVTIKLHEMQLESQVEDRTRKLEQAYEFQKHLVRSIGHDMQQPVFALSNLLASLKYAIHDPDLNDTIRDAEILNKTALRFIRSTLGYAKREAGQVAVTNVEFPIQRVFDQIGPMFEQDAEDRKVSLDIQSTSITMSSDEHLVWEALANLVQNAVRLSVRGQIVSVSAYQEDSQVILVVLDEYRGQIDTEGSAGFGLEIVRQISELLQFKFELSPNQAKISFIL